MGSIKKVRIANFFYFIIFFVLAKCHFVRSLNCCVLSCWISRRPATSTGSPAPLGHSKFNFLLIMDIYLTNEARAKIDAAATAI